MLSRTRRTCSRSSPRDPRRALALALPLARRRRGARGLRRRRRDAGADDPEGADDAHGRLPARPRRWRPGKPVTVSFKIVQPSGDKLVTMKRFRTGSGPHTGVHMIIVRDDLGAIIHRHPPMSPDGSFKQEITFPDAGQVPRRPRRLSGQRPPQPNFQLSTARSRSRGRTSRSRCRRRRRPRTWTATSFKITKVVPAKLRAIEPALISMTVTDPHGQAGEADAVVRRPRARDLLPPGALRVLPHARLQPRSGRLHQRARRQQGHRQLGDAREADRRRDPARLRAPGGCSCR